MRELSGYDELNITGTDTGVAIRLLDRLLSGQPQEHQPPSTALQMTADKRDEMLVSIYIQTFGPKVESTVRCSHCGASLDLDFSLKELQSTVLKNAQADLISQETNHCYVLPDGSKFRMLTGEDECAVAEMQPEEAVAELTSRSVLECAPTSSSEAIESAMESVAPILDLELVGKCTECETEQYYHFDIQSFLLSALMMERETLILEVHRLACTYGWNPDEILRIPRSLRKTLVSLIESEVPAQWRDAR